MATQTLGPTAVTATLTASTADTVFPTKGGPVEVINLDSSFVIWIRWDGTEATVAGADCVPVPPSSAFRIPAYITAVNGLSVISSGTPQYTVSKIVSQL